MRPMAVIAGILLGTLVSITVSLAGVLVVFLMLGADYPRLDTEFRPLIVYSLAFFVLTLISAVSFYAALIEHQKRWLLQGVLWMAMLLIGSFFVLSEPI